VAPGALAEVVLVLAAAAAVAAVLRYVRVPAVVGFMVAGVVIGPGGLGLVGDRAHVETLAEVGVILLLFTVGLKLSLKDLWRLRGAVFGGGAAQVVLTGGAGFGVAVAFGASGPAAVVWGMLIALSSTALVLSLLEDGGDTGTREGRSMVAILLFQDLAVIPIMLALPLLAGHAGSLGQIAIFAGRAVAVLGLTVVVGRYVFPVITARVVATRSRELFTLVVFLAAVGTALVVGGFGISMALGAFLAGMVISESEFVSRIVADLTPVRDILNALFFASVGMPVDTGRWIVHPQEMLGMVGAVIAAKAVLAGLVGWGLTRRLGSGLVVGLGLAQIGEFSFIVAREAANLGLLAPSGYDLFFGAAVPSMVLTPGMLAVARWLEPRLTPPEPTPAAALRDHVVIVGYGVNGRNVSHALQLLDVPHLVVDVNPHTAEEIAAQGGQALWGDARHDRVLRAAGVPAARALIAAVPDAASTREVVAAARALNPRMTILARTRYLREVEPLQALGANEVIPEEFETSLELTGRVLALYGAPRRVVDREKAALRASQYGALRSGDVGGHLSLDELLEHADLIEVAVAPGSPAVEMTLRKLALRERTGATVVAVKRRSQVIANPPSDLELNADDVLVLWCDSDQAEATARLLAAV
jgi:monovalent cation:H+ antiporter-2, CPA2 family